MLAMDPAGRSILVVEDDRKTSAAVKLYLESAGFEVAVAFDGRQALEAARARQPGHGRRRTGPRHRQAARRGPRRQGLGGERARPGGGVRVQPILPCFLPVISSTHE
jgi:CheY-like chemotaxis protein